MLDRKTLQKLGCWKGYQLERVEWPKGDGRTLSLYLEAGEQGHALRTVRCELPAGA